MACFTILILDLLHKFGNLFSVFMDDHNVFLGMCQIEIVQTFSLVDSVRRWLFVLYYATEWLISSTPCYIIESERQSDVFLIRQK